MIQTVCAFLSAAGAVERVGWVLVHSLWQLAVEAAATAVLHRSGAIVRHAGLASGLVAMAVLPVVTRWAVDVTPAPAGFTAPAASSAQSPSTSSLPAAQLEAINRARAGPRAA